MRIESNGVRDTNVDSFGTSPSKKRAMTKNKKNFTKDQHRLAKVAEMKRKSHKTKMTAPTNNRIESHAYISVSLKSSLVELGRVCSFADKPPPPPPRLLAFIVVAKLFNKFERIDITKNNNFFVCFFFYMYVLTRHILVVCIILQLFLKKKIKTQESTYAFLILKERLELKTPREENTFSSFFFLLLKTTMQNDQQHHQSNLSSSSSSLVQTSDEPMSPSPSDNSTLPTVDDAQLDIAEKSELSSAKVVDEPLKKKRKVDLKSSDLVQQIVSTQDPSLPEYIPPTVEEVMETKFGKWLLEKDKKALESGAIDPDLLDWRYLKSSHKDTFVFANKLVGNSVHPKVKKTETSTSLVVNAEQQNVRDAPIVTTNDIQAFDMTHCTALHEIPQWQELPFLLLSFFFDSSMWLKFDPKLFVLFQFNTDKEMDKHYLSQDSENGKMAYNPRYLLIDQLSLSLLSTFDFQFLFNVSDEEDLKRKMFPSYSTLDGVLLIDRYAGVDNTVPHQNLKDAVAAIHLRCHVISTAYTRLANMSKEAALERIEAEKKRKQQEEEEEKGKQESAIVEEMSNDPPPTPSNTITTQVNEEEQMKD